MGDKQGDRYHKKRDHETKRTPPSSSALRGRCGGFGRALISNVVLLFAGACFRSRVAARGRRIPGRIRGRGVFVRHALFFKLFWRFRMFGIAFTHTIAPSSSLRPKSRRSAFSESQGYQFMGSCATRRECFTLSRRDVFTDEQGKRVMLVKRYSMQRACNHGASYDYVHVRWVRQDPRPA